MNVKTSKAKKQVNIENETVNLLSKEELNKRIEVIKKELRSYTWRELETKGKFVKNDKLSFITDDMLIVGCDIGSEMQALKILNAAMRSIGLRTGLTEARMEIQDLIEDYELQTKHLERVNDLIKELCQQIRYADKLLEIKGIGITTVAGFIAEVGDITRFGSTKELQKLAGLELVADSSGKHNGKTKISKRGHKRLRYLLFEAAISVVGKNEEFKEIHRYYTTREKNPLKKMQSLIAVACKLIRVFHVILTKGVSYDASKMLEDIRHPGEQLKVV